MKAQTAVVILTVSFVAAATVLYATNHWVAGTAMLLLATAIGREKKKD